MQSRKMLKKGMGMAEMIVPNGTWIRIEDNKQIQVIALDTDLSETDVAAGVVRFYNKGPNSVIKATSPFGIAMIKPGNANNIGAK